MPRLKERTDQFVIQNIQALRTQSGSKLAEAITNQLEWLKSNLDSQMIRILERQQYSLTKMVDDFTIATYDQAHQRKLINDFVSWIHIIRVAVAPLGTTAGAAANRLQSSTAQRSKLRGLLLLAR